VSTFTDGAPPSVAPDPEDGPGSGSDWLREEMARRMAARGQGSGGRHARRENAGTDGAAANGSGGVPFALPDAESARVPRHARSAPAAPAQARDGRTPTQSSGTQNGQTQGGPFRNRQVQGGPLPRRVPGDAAARNTAGIWTGPQRPDHGTDRPASTLGAPSLPAAGVPAVDTATGAPSRPTFVGPSRPAPPSGAAAARLLSPRLQVPSSVPPPTAPPVVGGPVAPAPGRTRQTGPQRPVTPPAGTPPTAGPPTAAPRGRPDPGPLKGPVEPFADPGRDAHDDDDDVDEPADGILWSASSMPPAEPDTPAPGVAVPAQRAGEQETADAPRGARFPRPEDDDAPAKRVRVVLAERKGVARPVRTVVDIQEGTAVGELLRSNLISSQLRVALRFAAGAGLTLGILPLLFALFPAIGETDVLGLRLPWLLLGVLVYPFLLGLGWWHTRTAERVEQSFADHVQE
jgi:hypothetical protein